MTDEQKTLTEKREFKRCGVCEQWTDSRVYLGPEHKHVVCDGSDCLEVFMRCVALYKEAYGDD